MHTRRLLSFADFEEKGLDFDEALQDDAQWEKVRALILQETYGGDTQAYQEDYDEVVLEAVSWRDIVASLNILPEWEQEGHAAITRCLGYLPHESTRLRHEPFIRALLKSYRSGALPLEDFVPQLEEAMKPIRNSDMTVSAYADYRPGVYARYDTFLPEYREAVQKRLAGFLGYVPERKHSLVAELWLRTVMAKDDYRFPEQQTEADRRAMTVVKYREILTVSGKEAADASPLLEYWL